MNTVVFLGPTLTVTDAAGLFPGATFRGPAACGDVYGAVREGVGAIGIIDGYFEHQPSVWHKELLWALSRGVRVYGAASMGALRAAELEPFGMVGVGRIFEQYRDGELSDDDEVAVAHEDAQRGFLPVSEAMVNIRATLAQAVTAGVLGEAERQELVALAKGLFYGERSYDALRREAVERGLGAASHPAFWSWLGEWGGANQKRDDACALLRRIAEDSRTPVSAVEPTFEFEYTDSWHAFKLRMDARFADQGARPAETGAQSDSGASPDAKACLRALAVCLAQADGVRPTTEQVQAHSELLRRRLGLLSPEATGAWLARHQLDLQLFSRIVYEDWLAEQCEERARALVAAQRSVLAALRGRGTTGE